MKKTLVRHQKQISGFKPLSFHARLGGGLALLALIAGLGFASSRPAHTAGGPIAVNVANTPLATKPTDVAAPQQPFTAQTTYVIHNGDEIGNLDTADGYTDIAVPAGKRLVIQTVSLTHMDNNNETIQAYVSPTTNGNNYFYALPSVPSNATFLSGATEALTVYADAGSVIPFLLYRNQSSGTELVSMTVSGYLVNA